MENLLYEWVPKHHGRGSISETMRRFEPVNDNFSDSRVLCQHIIYDNSAVVYYIVNHMNRIGVKELQKEIASVLFVDLYSLMDHEYLTDRVVQWFTKAYMKGNLEIIAFLPFTATETIRSR